MKTQVIHLDSHDDLISIRDRMAWAKTPRILFVWPKRGHVDVRPLDLTLLRRHAESLGAELGLVTRDPEIRAAARELGISFFSTPADAQKKQWVERHSGHPSRRFPRLDLRIVRRRLPASDFFTFLVNPASRMGVFSAGVLSVLVVMLIFIPSAEIRITPPEQIQSLTIAVSAEPDVEKVQVSGVIPAHSLTQIVEGLDSVSTTGKTVVPDQKATGECLFMNLTDGIVSVPAGTILVTTTNPPVAFETVDQTEIPGGKGKSSTVRIHAVVAGLSGNVPTGTISAFEGPLGLSLAVLNSEPASGGTEVTVFTPTAKDRELLKTRLLARLENQAKSHFPSQIPVGDMLFPTTFTLSRIVDEVFTPPAGQVGAKLSLTLRVEYAITYATSNDLQQLAVRVLDASLPAGYLPKPGAVILKVASPVFEGQGIVRWQMVAERTLRPAIDSAQVISLVQGKTARRAGTLLEKAFGLTQPPEISIRPLWWPWLPLLPISINVTS